MICTGKIAHAFNKGGPGDAVKFSHPLPMTTHDHPWNKDRAVGQKRPFTTQHIILLTQRLDNDRRLKEMALFCLGIDTMLRGSDLLRLVVRDVMDCDGGPKAEFTWSQKKTGKPVVTAITPFTQLAVRRYISQSNLKRDDLLFTAQRGDGGKPITTNYLRRLVKKWAVELGLGPENYAAHSLRRSKPSHLYAQGVKPEMLRLLLGHTSLQSTQEYLGIDQGEALALAQKYDCFKET